MEQNYYRKVIINGSEVIESRMNWHTSLLLGLMVPLYCVIIFVVCIVILPYMVISAAYDQFMNGVEEPDSRRHMNSLENVEITNIPRQEGP